MVTLRFIPSTDPLALTGARVINDATGEEIAQLKKVVYEHEAGFVATLKVMCHMFCCYCQKKVETPHLCNETLHMNGPKTRFVVLDVGGHNNFHYGGGFRVCSPLIPY